MRRDGLCQTRLIAVAVAGIAVVCSSSAEAKPRYAYFCLTAAKDGATTCRSTCRWAKATTAAAGKAEVRRVCKGAYGPKAKAWVHVTDDPMTRCRRKHRRLCKGKVSNAKALGLPPCRKGYSRDKYGSCIKNCSGGFYKDRYGNCVPGSKANDGCTPGFYKDRYGHCVRGDKANGGCSPGFYKDRYGHCVRGSKANSGCSPGLHKDRYGQCVRGRNAPATSSGRARLCLLGQQYDKAKRRCVKICSGTHRYDARTGRCVLQCKNGSWTNGRCIPFCPRCYPRCRVTIRCLPRPRKR